MGQATNGIVFWGVAVGDDESEVNDRITDLVHGEEGIERYGDGREWLAEHGLTGIEFVHYCSETSPMWGIAAEGTVVTAYRGWVKRLDLAQHPAPDWSINVHRAVEALGAKGSLWTFCNWRSVPVVMRAALDAGLPLTSLAVWDKEWIGPGGSVGLRPSYELVALLAKPEFGIPDRGVADVFRHKVGSYKPNGHPAEKPVPLVRRLIEVAAVPAGGLVLDPFMGSGTAAMACRDLGRRFIGIEAEEKWCELAASRLAQGDLFGDAA